MSVRAGEALRRQGQQQAENAADPRVAVIIDGLVAARNRTGEVWSVNDIRAALPVSARGLVGARVDAARKRGEMEAVGWVKSTLASTRGKPVTVWRGKRPEAGAAAHAFLFACFLMLLAGLVVGYVAMSPMLTLDLAR